MVIVPVQETDVAAVAQEVAQGVGGVLLFGNEAPSRLGSQLRTLDSSALGGISPLVMTDEEGGGVQRMANLVGAIPWARQMGQTLTAAQIQALAAVVGAKMLRAGVTMDLAPVLDVDGAAGPNARDPDGERSFSADPQVAATDGIAFAAGLVAAGVVPVVKHFPGLGGASGNTDDGPATTEPYAELLAGGLIPFEDAIAAGLPAVMVSNASIPGLTKSPASLSPAAIRGLLIGKLGFRGLIMTDSLSAGAIAALHLGVPQATVLAIEAGADMVMFTSASPEGVLLGIEQSVTQAVGAGQVSLPELTAAVGEILAVKGVDLCEPNAEAPASFG